ncbi:MAG: hypothetical protein GTO61_04030 [Gemmatimonadales bacterium]|nr:hypothetical protein [Gemmatimonadales bacterium]
MMSIAQIYSPSIEHVVDEVWSVQTRADQDEEGEPDGRAEMTEKPA